ncbi:MAG: 23S rRNA (guanosine(2251)-2'-O)-methyltransferase RlmB [Butyrivibrio sp.]|nr:23S rRNA (guanosine(2251)-2'-O)-methyltransferase RlmB [Butyrivibrio sp.]
MKDESIIREETNRIEGRNAVLEVLKSGRSVDRIYLLDGGRDGALQTIRREAKKREIPLRFVDRDALDRMSETGHHQGVIAQTASYRYSELEDAFALAEQRGEAPFLILLDGIGDPHNLGAILRSAEVVGAHGVLIPKDRAVGLTATVARTSAGALNYIPVIKVTNLNNTIEQLKKRGLWFVCADMDGTEMYDLDLSGPIGLVIGAEGTGVAPLVKKHCDMIARIPMRGQINSLNASVAAGVLSYEILRQRLRRG